MLVDYATKQSPIRTIRMPDGSLGTAIKVHIPALGGSASLGEVKDEAPGARAREIVRQKRKKRR